MDHYGSIWVTNIPICLYFLSFLVCYDLFILKLSSWCPLIIAACYVVADSYICHEQQVIQLQSCGGHTYYFVCRLFLNFCCPFSPCIIKWPACQEILQCTAGDCVGFRVLCDQLYNIVFPRLWGSDVPIVPVSLIHVTPWTVIAGNNPPLELDAPIQATASLFLILDVPVFHRQSFGNMTF